MKNYNVQKRAKIEHIHGSGSNLTKLTGLKFLAHLKPIKYYTQKLKLLKLV